MKQFTRKTSCCFFTNNTCNFNFYINTKCLITFWTDKTINLQRKFLPLLTQNHICFLIIFFSKFQTNLMFLFYSHLTTRNSLLVAIFYPHWQQHFHFNHKTASVSCCLGPGWGWCTFLIAYSLQCGLNYSEQWFIYYTVNSSNFGFGYTNAIISVLYSFTIFNLSSKLITLLLLDSCRLNILVSFSIYCKSKEQALLDKKKFYRTTWRVAIKLM